MEYKLNELFDLQMGKTPSRDNPDYWDSNDHKWISISDLSKCGKYISDTKEYLSEKAVIDSGISQIPANTVIMSFKLSIGKTAITAEPMYSNEAIMSFRDLHKIDLLPDYIYYLLCSKNWDAGTNKAVMGKTLNKATLSQIKVKVHTYSEQKEIVQVLDIVNSIIESRKNELQSLDNLIKARFVELFGNGHDGVCKTEKLGDFCKFQQGTQVPAEDQIEEKMEGYTRFLRIIDYTQAPQEPRYVSVKGREIAEDSVVIVRYGATAGFVGHGYAGILANNLFEVVPDESVLSKDFLYLALRYGTFEKEVHDKAFGAAMPALSFGMMKDIGVVAPNSSEQNDFVEFVKQVDKSKFAVQKALEKAQLLFDSLIQQYFG